MAYFGESIGHQAAKRPRVEFSHGGMHGTDVAKGSTPNMMSQQYIEQQLNKKSLEPEKQNHILLFTIFNPNYPITCEVLNTICSPYGEVLRIVIFRKNGVQAMVEFETVDYAIAAKENLHGCDIYSGCCTLKIEFAKPTRLNVYKNCQDSFDYTNPNPGAGFNQETTSQTHPTGPQRTVLLKEPLVGRHQGNHSKRQSHGGYENGTNSQDCPLPDNLEYSAPQGFGRQGRKYYGGANSDSNSMPFEMNLNEAGQTVASIPNFTSQGSVCMVYGLNSEKMNANRLFNLFCLYGNVIRVKFLKTKEGCAMVQLGDAASVERSMANLNNVMFFGSKMQVGYSKQAFLTDVQAPYTLSDGTPSFMDFMGSKNNRFMNPEMASKNRIQPPTKILHFFNTPPSLDESHILKLFAECGIPQPKCIKLFPSKTDRSSSGLVEFFNQSDALECLVCCNHLPVNSPGGKFPFIMKLCFSSSKNIPTTMREV